LSFVRLAWLPAESDDRRPSLLGKRRPLHSRLGEDERPDRRIDPLAVELERRTTAMDEVELLGINLLFMLIDDPVTRLPARECINAKGRDADDAEQAAKGSGRPRSRRSDLAERPCIHSYDLIAGALDPSRRGRAMASTMPHPRSADTVPCMDENRRALSATATPREAGRADPNLVMRRWTRTGRGSLKIRCPSIPWRFLYP
jgi:hypothetical protein